MGIFSSVGSRRLPVGSETRQCRFEQMESRRMMAADVAVGAAGPPLLSPGVADGSISGGVFAENESGAVGMANVRVQLLGESGAVIEEQVTDGQGAYQFSALLPGTYAVQEVTPDGYFDVLSQAGSGGGMALNPNLFGEIVVGSGTSLTGYNFYDSLNVVGQGTGGDRRIDTHGVEEELVPILALTMQAATERPVASEQQEAGVAEVVVSDQGATTTLYTSHEGLSFGGSGRAVRRSEQVESQGDSPFESLFSLTGFLELASANLPKMKPLGQLVDEMGVELEELWSEIEVGGEESDAEGVEPRIARRYDSSEKSSHESDAPAAEETPAEDSQPSLSRTAGSEHAEAVDEIFATENRVDFLAVEPSDTVAERDESSEAPQRQAS